MAIKSLFPEEMMNSGAMSLSLDKIKAKLNYFELQLHELHWQTRGFAEHSALGTIYDKVFDLKDEIVEKIMGYTGMRTKAMPVDTIKDYAPGMAEQVVNELQIFAKQLEAYGEQNGMPDIENIAQSLSGEAAQTKYRLTLS
jgi:DNA-binding ferritin-like protein|tara:strand:+ start:929 stop:1351 length:423 start_codon:yes stop_codon:yes gene_type:complete